MFVQIVAKLGPLVVSVVMMTLLLFLSLSYLSHITIVSSFTRLILTAGKIMTAGTTAS